ncbi:MAG: copper chaperone PCu(A)C [Leptospiraceae bacterium]|nr:copper chaperone PCu(A)C [Leptospiraceae bacterium]
MKLEISRILGIGTISLFVLITLQCKESSLGISDMWVREPLKGMGMTAGYMKLSNQGPESIELTKAECPDFEKLELHETIMDGDVMKMRPVESLTIKPGETLELKPHAHHLMLIGPKKEIKAGDSLEITLYFRNAPARKLALPVKAME